MAKIKYLTHIVLIAVISITCKGCSSCTDNNAGHNKLVCVSLEPQRWIAEQIAGERLKVVSMLPGDADPENFDPPMSALKDASDAVVYMQSGYLPWEDNMIKRVKESNPDLLVIDTARGIDLITGTHSHDGHSHETDPHTWTSVKNAKIIAANMLEGLKKADSIHADFYEANYNKLVLRLDSLDNSITERLAPVKGGSFVVWHPSLSYFARDYGLTQIAIGSENKESTIRTMQRRIDEANNSNVSLFFVQPDMDGAKSDEIIALTGAEKVIIHPIAYDWLNEMEIITDALSQKLLK